MITDRRRKNAMKEKEQEKTSYKRLIEAGYCLVGMKLPIDKRDELVEQAQKEGLSLAAYCRKKLIGEKYTVLRRIYKKDYVR